MLTLEVDGIMILCWHITYRIYFINEICSKTNLIETI